MITMRLARSADGFVRHVPTAFTPAPPKRGARNRTAPDPIKTNGESAAEQLRLLIERVERLDAELTELQDDRRDVLAEVKSIGFDLDAFRAILALRKKDKDRVAEQEAIFDLYRQHLGLL